MMQHTGIILLAEVLADSASFADCDEVSAALANLGYETAALGVGPVAAEIDERCAAALLQAAIPRSASRQRVI